MKKTLRYKFTEAVINKLDPPSDRDRYYVYDTVFPGLCLMVTRRHRRTGTFRRTFYLNCCIDGRSRRIRIGEAKNITLVQARKQAKILGGLVESGVDPMEAKREKRREMTLDDLMGEYLARHAKPHKKTWEQDERLYKRRLSRWARCRLSSITPREIDRYHKQLSDEVGIYTANAMLTLLKTMFNKAKKWRHFKGENPTNETALFRTKSRERWITPEEMPHFMASLKQYPDDDFRDYVLVSLYTGARQGNVLAMRWEDISLDEMVWTIPLTKNGESLVIDLVEATRSLLIRRRFRQAHNEEWVLPDPESRTGHMKRPWYHWRKFLRTFDIEDLRMHDLRHTHASWLIETGADISDVQVALGHKKFESSLRYAHWSRGRTRLKRGLAVGGMLEAAKPVRGLKKESDGVGLAQPVSRALFSVPDRLGACFGLELCRIPLVAH